MSKEFYLVSRKEPKALFNNPPEILEGLVFLSLKEAKEAEAKLNKNWHFYKVQEINQ